MAASLILLSGGLDSATALALSASDNAPCRGLFLSYGQAAAREEMEAAKALADHYRVTLRTLTLNGLHFDSGEIPGRNAFLIYCALLTVRPEPTAIVVGLHAGTTYIDCTPKFVEAMSCSLDLHTGGEVALSAPFLNYSKADIFLLARELSVPIDLTYSCERGGGPCGECLSCKDRECLSAFA